MKKDVETKQPLKLLIVIPALNEQDSIKEIIKRSLEAKKTITSKSPVTDVQITVVSDGSTDRTVEYAKPFADKISLIVFTENRGYGAAIKEAWSRSDAQLLGFIDADGTCDPNFFTDLCNSLVSEGADVVLGSRIHGESKMPLHRRMGNILFASLLSLFSSQKVCDIASGMRVLKRESLPKIMPLPDGLHFTPAMTARTLQGENLKLVEIPMPYHEREGDSKLHAVKDGIRFLKVILDATLFYNPSKILGFSGILSLLISSLLLLNPLIFYIQNKYLLDWMIYRFLIGNLFGITGCLLICGSYLTRRIVRISVDSDFDERTKDFVERFFSEKLFWVVPLTFFLIGCFMVFNSLLDWIQTRTTIEHWSRFIIMAFFLSTSLILMITKIVDYTLDMVMEKIQYLKK